MSAPTPRKKPMGKPLNLDDAALDKAATVTPEDAADADAYWRRGVKGKLAGLLQAKADEDE